MVANHWSNDAMFAMYGPSLFMMMIIVTIIIMIFKSTNTMGTRFIIVNRWCHCDNNNTYCEAQITRHFLFILLPHQMSSQELSHQEWCWRYTRSQEQPAASILAMLAMGSVYSNKSRYVYKNGASESSYVTIIPKWKILWTRMAQVGTEARAHIKLHVLFPPHVRAIQPVVEVYIRLIEFKCSSTFPLFDVAMITNTRQGLFN